MVPVNEALDTIRQQVSLRRSQVDVAVQNAQNQVLSADVKAQHDIPRVDNSAMDGFVMQKSDLKDGQTTFPIADEIRPEDDVLPEIQSGTCARIMTGAPIPPGGDQVVPVEMVEEDDDSIRVLNVPGRNPIRPRGEGYAQGTSLIEAGTVIRPYEVGLMIESGNKRCTIKKPIQLALQVTGSEIDEENDTNGPVLERLMASWPGVEVTRWPVLGDDPSLVKERLRELKSSADVLVTTGGISAGKHDYLFQTMQQLGATCHVRKIAQKPGKPFTFSTWDDLPVCHLPGNPVSAVFSAECYARVVIAKMLGLQTRTVRATTRSELKNHREKTLFVTGRLTEADGVLKLRAQDRMRSHLLQLYTGENTYVRIPPKSHFSAGEKIECIPFSTEPWIES